MKLSIIDITTKKHGIRSKITINKKSIENHELFTNSKYFRKKDK